MLEANPTINLLWAANEGGTVAHALAVQSSGLAGEVFVFGTDMNNQMAQMLQADDDILQGVLPKVGQIHERGDPRRELDQFLLDQLALGLVLLLLLGGPDHLVGYDRRRSLWIEVAVHADDGQLAAVFE